MISKVSTGFDVASELNVIAQTFDTEAYLYAPEIRKANSEN